LQTDAYFVTNSSNQTQKSLFIKLKDVCIVSWEGTKICHCTSVRIHSNNSHDIFGQQSQQQPDFSLFEFSWYLECMKAIEEKEYSRIIRDVMENMNWIAFAHAEYEDEKFIGEEYYNICYCFNIVIASISVTFI